MVIATRAALISPETFELEEHSLIAGSDEVIIKIAACGICSSEIPRYDGTNIASPSGPGSYPIYMGHEPSGTVVETGSSVVTLQEGDRVSGAIGPNSGGYATHALAKADSLYKVPDNIPLEHALAEPLFCVTNIARAASPSFGDHVAVVGCGAMGLLAIAALNNNGLGSLIAVDRFQQRRSLAMEIGATHSFSSDEAVSEVMDLTQGGCDVVIEITGGPSGLELSADLLKIGQGSLIMAGYHHSANMYNLRNFAYKGLVAHQAHPHYSPDQNADYKRALAALGKGVFPIDKLITHQYGLDEVGAGFNALRSNQADFIKGIVVPNA